MAPDLAPGVELHDSPDEREEQWAVKTAILEYDELEILAASQADHSCASTILACSPIMLTACAPPFSSGRRATPGNVMCYSVLPDLQQKHAPPLRSAQPCQ